MHMYIICVRACARARARVCVLSFALPCLLTMLACTTCGVAPHQMRSRRRGGAPPTNSSAPPPLPANTATCVWRHPRLIGALLTILGDVHLRGEFGLRQHMCEWLAASCRGSSAAACARKKVTTTTTAAAPSNPKGE